MSEIPKSEIISPDGDSIKRPEYVAAAPAQADPFDPASLRLDPDYLKSGGVKKLLTTVPVRKPNKQDFVRVHPDPAYRVCGVAIIELQEERETYLVIPEYAQGLDPRLFICCNLYLAINRQKVLFLWPTKLPTPGGHVSAWHSSGLEGAEKAMTHWIRVVPNTDLGAYEFFVAESHLSEPEWPPQPLGDFIQIGFKDRIISGPDHPVMQKLRGAI